MSRTRWKFGEGRHPYFLTDTIVGWLPLFTRTWAVEIVLDSWNWLIANRGTVLLGYVVLENHLHWIANLQEPSRDVSSFKSFTARRIIDRLLERGEHDFLKQLEHHKLPHKFDRQYQLWQEGSQPKLIDHDEMMLQKLDYIHYNPVRRGYVDQPTDWRYSSARNYARLPALMEVVTDWR